MYLVFIPFRSTISRGLIRGVLCIARTTPFVLLLLAVDLRPYYVAMPFVRAESAQNSTVPADVARNRRHYVCDVCGLD